MNDDVFVTPADLHRLMHSDVGVTILDARHADFRHSGDEPGFSGTIPGNRIPAVGPSISMIPKDPFVVLGKRS